MEFFNDFGKDFRRALRPNENREEFIREKENEIQKEKSKLQTEREELFLISKILHEIIGLTPNLQRDIVGENYKQYAEQSDLPNLRDAVIALRNISKKEWPSKV